MPAPSPRTFLDMPRARRVAENTLAFAVRDNYPVSPGHTLVIPKRLVATWFDATHEEQHAIMSLVEQIKTTLDTEYRPDGYNVGFNAGAAAGQTVMHLHVHVIPRFAGDMPDPRGGVRHVIPGKGNYLTIAHTAAIPEDSVFAENLLSLLDSGSYTTTYKYAVLLGLMDLCLEKSTAAGDAPTSVTTRELAEKVLALYWPQSRPFPIGDTVLRQNSDPRKPAKILARLIAFRQQHARDATASIGRARKDAPAAFQELLRDIEWSLVEMPLPRLQKRGDRGGDAEAFLYAIEWTEALKPAQFKANDFDNTIRFLPGAAAYLATSAPLLRPVIQRRWAGKVAQLNDTVFQDAQLEDFLFGGNRISLLPITAPLVELHEGRCFYCNKPLGDHAHIDHFIAWSRHPDDSIENLVPAHVACNLKKSDHLAGTPHVARWLARSRQRAAELDAIAHTVRWERGNASAEGAGRSIYLRLRAGVRLWLEKDHFETVDPRVVSGLFREKAR